MNYVVLSDSTLPRNAKGYHNEAVNFWNLTVQRLSQEYSEVTNSIKNRSETVK